MLYIRREGAESDSKIEQAKTKYTGMSKILQKWSHLMSHTPSFEGTDMFNNQTGLYVGQCGGQSTKIY